MARRHRSHRSHRAHRGSFRQPLTLLKPAVTGAAGALAVNGIINYAPIPDNLKAGNMLYLTRAAIAVLLGIFGPRLPLVGSFAREGAIGSLIVTATDFGKVLALQTAGVNLSGLGYTGPARVVRMNGPAGVGALYRGGAMLRAPTAAPNVAGVGRLMRVGR